MRDDFTNVGEILIDNRCYLWRFYREPIVSVDKTNINSRIFHLRAFVSSECTIPFQFSIVYFSYALTNFIFLPRRAGFRVFAFTFRSILSKEQRAAHSLAFISRSREEIFDVFGHRTCPFTKYLSIGSKLRSINFSRNRYIF